MAIRSKEFINIAEGIKSHEISIKGTIDSLKSTLSDLKQEKESIQNEIYSLQAELAAAWNDTDEDGDPDYGRIAAIQDQLDRANESLDATNDEISDTTVELNKSEQEFERVEEEKAQTLFEIQQRAKKTANNITIVGGMYGAYADVASSMSQSFQQNYDALSHAAGILGGSVDSITSSKSASPSSVHGNAPKSQAKSMIAGAGIVGASSIPSNLPASGRINSVQISGIHAYQGRFHGKIKSLGYGGEKRFDTTQKSLGILSVSHSDSMPNHEVGNNYESTQHSAVTEFAKNRKIDKSSIDNKRGIVVSHSAGSQQASLVQATMLVSGKAKRDALKGIRTAAEGDLSHFQKNEPSYTFQDYTNNPTRGYINPNSVLGMDQGNSKSFWTYKGNNHTKDDYIEMAQSINQVRILHDYQGKTYDEIAAMGGVIGACATYYFINAIQVEKIGSAYLFQGDGRHRLEAARAAGVNEIPVNIIGEQIYQSPHNRFVDNLRNWNGPSNDNKTTNDISLLTGIALAKYNLMEYMQSHNYGKQDFSRYSNDPEWKKLHRDAYPENYTLDGRYKYGDAVQPQSITGSTTIDTYVRELPDKEKLPETISQTFSEGKYRTVITTVPIKLYRVYGGHARKEGSFLTTQKPTDRMEAKIGLALLPEWKNTREFFSEVIIPEGTVLNIGNTAPQYTPSGNILPGGMDQIVISKDFVQNHPESFSSDQVLGYNTRFKDFNRKANIIEKQAEDKLREGRRQQEEHKEFIETIFAELSNRSRAWDEFAENTQELVQNVSAYTEICWLPKQTEIELAMAQADLFSSIFHTTIIGTVVITELIKNKITARKKDIL